MSTKTKSDSPITAPVAPSPAPSLPPTEEPIPKPTPPVDAIASEGKPHALGTAAIAPPPPIPPNPPPPVPPKPPEPPPVQQSPPPPPPAPKAYFFKEVLTSKYVVDGKAVPFEALDMNCGVIALDTVNDAPLVAALREAASKHIGGIIPCDLATYDAKKKAYPWRAKPTPGTDSPLRTMPSGPPKAKPQSSPSTGAGAPPVKTSEPTDAEVQAPPDRPDYEKFIPKTARIGEKENAVVADV